MSRLGNLLSEPRDPNTVVAQRSGPAGSGTEFTNWGAFREDVARLANRIADGPEGAWILLTEDSYAFAVGLFGLWHTGRHALSPPNHQPESVRALRTHASGVLTDHPEWFSPGSTLDPLLKTGPSDPGRLRSIRRDLLALELYTSGTTGDGKAVTKRIAHLEDEVAELGQIWDDQAESATVFSTASHQHFYSLMIAVLWPLCSGRPFERRRYLHAAELVPRMKESRDSILVSVPTHLKRFVRHTQITQLKGSCRAVFSSGGPLASETAYRAAEMIGSPPIEIFGSTETGIIAWRNQKADRNEDLWAPVPSVRVSRDDHSGAMRVVSPFVSVESGEDGFSTGDHVETRSENRFVLLPRQDRVVKIGEKRLDLARMESDLCGLDWIDEIALVPIERENEPRVAAALVPSEAGRDYIDGDDHSRLTRAIRSRLSDAWDPVLHPRLWRIVEQLPENPQGKVTREALLALFETRDEKSVVDRPVVVERLSGPDFVEHACVVPENLTCLPGHFPGSPVVPAVLQLDWAIEIASELIGAAPHIEAVPRMKMLMQLQPGQSFRIRVHRTGPRDLQFRLWNQRVVFSHGRLKLEAVGSTP